MAVAAEAHYRAAGRARPRDRLHDRPARHARGARRRPPERASTSSRRGIRRRTRRASQAAERALGAGGDGNGPTIWCSCCCRAAPRRCGRRRRPASTLADKTALTRGLLKCGADIHEMNTVRRHISRIKGGRLRKATPARMLTLAISDVPGDDPATIGSGPTVPDPTTLADARAVLDRRRPAMQALGLTLPPAVDAALADPANETPKPGDPGLRQRRVPHHRHARRVARCGRRAGEAPGYEVVDLGDGSTGEAREVAAGARQAGARGQGRRPQGRHHQRRRARGDRAQRQGPRRAQPGIRAGAGHRARRRRRHFGAGGRHGRHRRRRRARSPIPAGAIIDAAHARRARATSMPRSSWTTTTPPASSRRPAGSSCAVPPIPTSTISVSSWSTPEPRTLQPMPAVLALLIVLAPARIAAA